MIILCFEGSIAVSFDNMEFPWAPFAHSENAKRCFTMFSYILSSFVLQYIQIRRQIWKNRTQIFNIWKIFKMNLSEASQPISFYYKKCRRNHSIWKNELDSIEIAHHTYISKETVKNFRFLQSLIPYGFSSFLIRKLPENSLPLS